MLAHGGDGGILASSYVRTELFVAVYERMTKNDHQGARTLWAKLEMLVPLLFKEANPMPIKHCLRRQGLIRSAECRLPLTRISEALAADLDRLMQTEGRASLPSSKVMA
jgi:4-hydroxy-tetrahydrodipicolinate synthase